MTRDTRIQPSPQHRPTQRKIDYQGAAEAWAEALRLRETLEGPFSFGQVLAVRRIPTRFAIQDPGSDPWIIHGTLDPPRRAVCSSLVVDIRPNVKVRSGPVVKLSVPVRLPVWLLVWTPIWFRRLQIPTNIPV